MTKNLAVGNVTVSLESIGPTEASEMLVNVAPRQRSLSPGTVGRYVQDMKSGNWPFVGDSIRMTWDGHVIDGQHRLSAVVESGTTQTFLVIRGLPEESIEVLDGGRPRSLADVLRIRGETNVTHLSSIITGYWYWTVNGTYGCRGISRIAPHLRDDYGILSRHPSRSELLARFDSKRELIRDATIQAMTLYRTVSMSIPPSRWGLAWLLLSDVNLDAREAFFHAIRGGAGLESGHPALTLLARLRSADPRLDDNVQQLAIILSAWNAFLEGRRVTSFRIPRDRYPWNILPMPGPAIEGWENPWSRTA